MLAPYPVRLRSNSSPARPKSAQEPVVNDDGIPGPSEVSVPKPIEGPTRVEKELVSPPKATGSPRRIFRLKRPSSSSAAMAPTFTSELPSPATSDMSPILTFQRARSRPSTPTGHKKERSSSSTRRDSLLFKGFGPIMATDFVTQRKKSRGGKSKASATIARVEEEAASASDAEIQFSTTDRTILEVLKKQMQAREEQFAYKNGKKHHLHPPSIVPYPRSYEPRVVDNDIWESIWTKQTCGGWTWHALSTQPSKVLDLGCGAGSWVIDAAMHWKDAHFVGLDIVPLHPDLYQTGSYQLASRIQWVQTNFLEKLPFQDEEFDFVHGKRIARGVPEDKWDALIEEVYRVLKPGGCFELFEEELSFPGKPVKPKPPEPIELTTSPSPPLSHTNSSASLADKFKVTFLPGTPNKPSHRGTGISHDIRAHLARYGPSFSDSLLSLGVVYPVSLPSTPIRSQSPALPPVPLSDPVRPSMDVSEAERQDDKPPRDPRDHSFLEHIYNEMHAARFINLEPLALLANSLSLIFGDVSTHPPLIVTFPPAPEETPPQLSAEDDSRTITGPTTLAQLLDAESPYVMLDDRRFNSLYHRPPRKSDLASSNSDVDRTTLQTPLSPHGKNEQLSITHVAFDLRALNMHLALRVQEILACAEEMWAFVLDYQSRYRSAKHDLALVGPDWRPGPPPFHQELASLDRKEFDHMLTRFRVDMDDAIRPTGVVQRDLGWAPVRSPDPPERVEFEDLCKKWVRFKQDLMQEYFARRAEATPHPIPSASSSEAHSEDIPHHEHGNSTYDQALRHSAPSILEEPKPLSSLPPQQRISRVMRVFVAWKS